MDQKFSVVWLRRDLRLHDNPALYHALSSGKPVMLLFIFDTNILDRLESNSDARLQFIMQLLQKMRKEISAKGSDILTYHGSPQDAFAWLTEKYQVERVYANEDYEPYGVQRDYMIEKQLLQAGVQMKLFQDHLIHEPGSVLKSDGTPFEVFTPFSRQWKRILHKESTKPYPSEHKLDSLWKTNPLRFPALQELGFVESPVQVKPTDTSFETISKYEETRNLPYLAGTTHVGAHLRFGSLSVRELTQKALKSSETYLNELIWREFFMHLMARRPELVDTNYRPKFNKLAYRNSEEDFEKWCAGKTGYPMVDAGMRQLNKSGWMHNRVRMITASFLTKHLLIDWRWGEAYFARHLVDYELSSNNGNWQWVAGTGCDAAPYFRIFNPIEQQKKFDPSLQYIKSWVPEFNSPQYPEPMVEHRMARDRALETYKRCS